MRRVCHAIRTAKTLAMLNGPPPEGRAEDGRVGARPQERRLCARLGAKGEGRGAREDAVVAEERRLGGILHQRAREGRHR